MKKLLILTLASSCLFGDLAKAAQVPSSPISTQNSTLIAKKETTVTKTTVKRTQTVRSQYDTFMKIAYTAYNKKDYNTALINFKRALAARPNNKYATIGIQNAQQRLAGK